LAPSTAPVVQAASAAEVAALWSKAMAHYTAGHWGKAAPLFERVTLEVPQGDSLAVEAHFRLAECYFAQKTQLQATREFRKVSDDSPNSRLAPDALLRAGDAFADLWRRPELDPSYGQSALATYQELVNRYPDSDAAQRAKQRIADLEEDFAQKEYKSALFYVRLKAYDSAILYLKDLVASYPRTTAAPTALIKLVEVYHKLGYQEDVTETCGYLRRFHPTTDGIDVSCPLGQDSGPAERPVSDSSGQQGSDSVLQQRGDSIRPQRSDSTR
jgi:outer membrane protein assembly factor BamD